MKQALTYSFKVWQTTMAIAAIIAFGIELKIYEDEEILIWVIMAIYTGTVLAVLFSIIFGTVLLIINKWRLQLAVQKLTLGVIGCLLLAGVFIYLYGLPNYFAFQIRM